MLFPAITKAQKRIHSIDWTVAGVLPSVDGNKSSLGLAGPVSGIHNNILIVGGGANFPGSMPWKDGMKKYYDELYAFTKKDGLLIHTGTSFHLPFTTAYGASCSTTKGIVYAGGENEKGLSNKLLLIRWNPASEKVGIKTLTDLPLAVTNASIACYENKVFLAGGETEKGVSSEFLWLDMDNASAGWKRLADLPLPVSHAVLLTRTYNGNTYVYLAGGRKKNSNGISDIYSFLYQYDLKSNRWNEKKTLPYALSAGAGIFVTSDYLLLFGGDRGETFHQVETCIAAIHAEKDDSKRQELIRQKNRLLSDHPGFSNEVLIYNATTDEWDVLNSIPFDLPVTTTAIQHGDEVIIPSGEIKAGVRTPKLLLGKLLLK